MPPKKNSYSRGTSPIPSSGLSRGTSPIRFNRVERETSPIPFKKYDKVISNLNQGEFMTAHQLPSAPMSPQRRLRNALILGGLGAAAGAMYKFRQPLMKLGNQAYNFAHDKFHNLFSFNQPSNLTNAIEPNHHHW